MGAPSRFTEVDTLFTAVERIREANGGDESPTLSHLEGILRKITAGETLTDAEIADAKTVADEWIAGFCGQGE